MLSSVKIFMIWILVYNHTIVANASLTGEIIHIFDPVVKMLMNMHSEALFT